jgi:hypothetical protein
MGQVMTPEFRVSYPNVLQPKRNELSGQDEFNVMAIFKKGTNLQVLMAAAQAAIEKKWGADRTKWPKPLKSPFRKHEQKYKEQQDGTKTLPPGFEAGGIFMNFKSRQRPGVVNEDVQPIIDPTEFYAGCYAQATVSAYAYDQKGNRGVAFGLGNIQKVRDGEPFGNRTKPEDDFQPVERPEGQDPTTEGDTAAASMFG